MAIQANKRKRRDTARYWLKEAARIAVNIGISVFETKTGIDITPGCDVPDCPKNPKNSAPEIDAPELSDVNIIDVLKDAATDAAIDAVTETLHEKKPHAAPIGASDGGE